MQIRFRYTPLGYILLAGLMLLLPACTSVPAPVANQASGPSVSVTEAFNSSGVIRVPAYRRTIFSTTDF